MLNDRSPSPYRTGTERGLLAISPHILIGTLACRPASIVLLMSFSTAGCSSSYLSDTRSFPRSTASVYCVRSLVPIEIGRGRVGKEGRSGEGREREKRDRDEDDDREG